MNSAIIKKGMQSNQIASLSLLFFYPETYASAFSAGITETDLLSALPTLNCTVPSTKAKRVWSLPIPMLLPGWNSVQIGRAHV